MTIASPMLLGLTLVLLIGTVVVAWIRGVRLPRTTVGCMLIGYLYGLFLGRPELPVEIRSGLLLGFLGALTTFSSFSLDTLRLLENGELPIALGYVAISVVGGLLATWAGLSLTKL